MPDPSYEELKAKLAEAEKQLLEYALLEWTPGLGLWWNWILREWYCT